MKTELTLLTCNYNTPKLAINLLKSVKNTSSELPNVLVANTSKDHHPTELDNNDIPYFQFRNGTHGEAVNLALRKIKTRYVLLVDSDVIFLKDFKPAFDKFKELDGTLMGKVVGDVAGKALYPRVEPWYCFIDLHKLKHCKIDFFDIERTRESKTGLSSRFNKIFDVGSTMMYDVLEKGLKVIDVNLEGKYFKHYGGMSWRSQKYNPDSGDTDIDFGGTHPHPALFEIGIRIKNMYDSETSYLEDVNIKGVFSND